MLHIIYIHLVKTRIAKKTDKRDKYSEFFLQFVDSLISFHGFADSFLLLSFSVMCLKKNQCMW